MVTGVWAFCLAGRGSQAIDRKERKQSRNVKKITLELG
jgi:hypothetical protein